LLLLPFGTPAARAASSDFYILTISQSKDPICAGDTVNVSISWAPNPRYGEDSGLAPLTPLTGPSRIQMKASLGHFYPETPPPPGSNSGTATVAYIAENTGTENLFAVAWSGGSSDAIAKDTFKVETCEYEYTFNGEFNLGVAAEGIAYTSRYTIKSRGILKAPDPDKPLNLEARSKTVKLGAMVTSFASSDCVLFTYEPGQGMGFVDVLGEPGPMDMGIVLKFAPPQDLAWDVDYSFACDGNGQTVAGVFPLTSEDPWITATFPSGSGTQNIKMDMFEVPLKRMQGQEGVTVSYTATVTLEKKAPK
jgi:hypothetical protein